MWKLWLSNKTFHLIDESLYIDWSFWSESFFNDLRRMYRLSIKLVLRLNENQFSSDNSFFPSPDYPRRQRKFWFILRTDHVWPSTYTCTRLASRYMSLLDWLTSLKDLGTLAVWYLWPHISQELLLALESHSSKHWRWHLPSVPAQWQGLIRHSRTVSSLQIRQVFNRSSEEDSSISRLKFCAQ